MFKNLTLGLCSLALAALACGSATGTPTAGAVVSTSQPGAATDVPSTDESTEPAAATEAPTAAASSLGEVGQPITLNGTEFLAAKVWSVKEVGGIFKADAGHVFFVSDITITNVGTEKIDYNFFYFSAKDADGFEYTIAVSAPEPTLKSGELQPGEKVRGNVAFQVPENAKAVVMKYEPLSFTDETAIRVLMGDVPAP